MSALSFNKIPSIRSKSTVEDVLAAFRGIEIPGMFEFSVKDGNLVLHSLKNEIKPQDITFQPSMLCKNTSFPVFCFCTAYLDEHAPLQYLTHWELMYLILDSRFKELQNYDAVYGGLIYSDIALVRDFVNYSYGNAYNHMIKMKSTIVLLNPYSSKAADFVYAQDRPLGDWLFTRSIYTNQYKAQAKKLDIVPSSESMLTKNKMMVYRKGLNLKAPGFKVVLNDAKNKVKGFYSIFPPKQNVPSRLKTHLFNEAFNCINNDEAIFLQDTVMSGGIRKTKDETFRNLVVLIETLEEDSYRFGAGEIEVSPDFAGETVYARKHRELQLDEVFIEAGQTYIAKGGSVKIGKHDEQLRTIDLVDKIEVLEVESIGYGNSFRIEYISYHKANNSRVVSLTGLKGVTKVMNNIGHLTTDDGQHEIKVDAVCSINSLKGKMNTIRLAQAALAFKLGYYKSSNGTHLNSWNEDEINNAVASLPTMTYVNNDGKIVNAKAGLIQASITELGSGYAVMKPQSLSFNCMKYLGQNPDTSLHDYIQENYINEDSKKIVMEYQKIVNDSYASLAMAEDLPIYQLPDMKNIFKESDLILAKQEIFPSQSKLLDPEFNKGFYIHCKPQRDIYIRIPSADILNLLWSTLPNGEYIYPNILINISKMIHACIGKEVNPDYFFIVQKMSETKARTTIRDSYLKDCTSTMFSEESSGQKMVGALLTPELGGFSLKQVFDKYVPDNTVVILNKNLYNQMYKHVYGKDEQDKSKSIMAFTLRNPFLWRTQTIIANIWTVEHFKAHLKDVHNIEIDEYLNVQQNAYCALIGKDIIARSHSDCDGDLISISTIKGDEGQKLLSEFVLSGVTEQQVNWDKDFLLSELESNEDFDWNKKYKIHYIPNNEEVKGNHDNYMSFLTNAAEAKNNVGAATNDVWSLYMLGEIYIGLRDEGSDAVITDLKGSSKLKFTREDLYIYDHIYTKLVEAKVINAIKHVENGSLGFQKYYLKSFNKPKHDKRQIIKEIMEENPGSNKKKIIELISLIMWADSSGYLLACKSFISMHNKGVVEKDADILEMFEDIIRHTMLGRKLKDFYNIREEVLNPSGSHSLDSSSLLSLSDLDDEDLGLF